MVDRVSLEVKQKEIVGLMGRNGAGKTTTFRMIMGLIRPEEGKVLLNDRDISSFAMYRRARLGIGYLAQEPSIFRGMTVAQNIMAILEFQALSRSSRKERLQELLQHSCPFHTLVDYAEPRAILDGSQNIGDR